MLDPLAIQGAQMIERLVARTRLRLRLFHSLSGLGWALAASLGWLLVWVSLDMAWPLPVWARCVVWAVFWTVIASLGAIIVFWPAVRPMSLAQVAFRIERAMPGMHNRLVTVLDLKNRSAAAADQESAGFVVRLVQQTIQRLDDFKIERVAAVRPVRDALATAALVIFAGAALFVPLRDRMPTALARMLAPTAAIAPVTSIAFQADPGDVEVLQGEPLTIRAKFLRGSTEEMLLRVRAGDNAPTAYPMRADDEGRLAFTITAVDASLTYQLVAGGTWSDEHRVVMIRRPVVQKVVAAVKLPEYMALPEPRPVAEDATQISAPAGSSIELSAQVSGDPVRGEASLLKASTRAVETMQVQELVWFEDDAPRDADLRGTWQWTTAHVFSGARAHTFNWRREPYGFQSRLSPLPLDPASDFFLYAWLDPADPPTRVVVTLMRDKQPIVLAWGLPPNADPAAAAAPGKPTPPPAAKPLFTGPLPATGRWVRLEAPFGADAALRAALGGTAATPSLISGITFETDRGRIIFDRAGALRRLKTTTQSTSYEVLKTLPLERDEKSGNWVGRVGVDADLTYALSFYSARGDASPAVKPMPVVATVDQPPSILVDKPGRSITLSEAAPVPLMVTALDDYGVADIGIRIGASPDTLNEPRWLQRYDQPMPSRAYLGAIDPRLMAIAPGGGAHYRVVVRDRKGQIGQSEVYRLGLAAPGQAQATGNERGPTPLAPLLDGIAKLLSVQGQIATGALDLLGSLPAGITRKVADDKSVKLLNPDGTEVTPEQLKAWLDKRWAEMTPQERAAVQKLDDQMAQQRIEALMLAQKLDAAALDAKASAVTLPQDAQALHAMAEQLREMAAEQPEQGDPASKLSPDVLSRLDELQKLSPEQQQEMADLKRQLEQLQAARAAMGDKPDAAQQQLSALLSDMQANWAMRQMDQLDNSLDSQRAKLADLQKQVADLQEQAKTAPGEKMDDIAKKQEELDAKALQTLKEAQDLLRERMAGQQDRPEAMPPEPWVAPGKRDTVEPSEADTPEEAKKKADAKKKDGDKAKSDADKAKEEEKKNWWDRPIDQPMLGQTLDDDPRHRVDPRFNPKADPKDDDAEAKDPKNDDPNKPADQDKKSSKPGAPHVGKRSNASGGMGTKTGTPRKSLNQHQSQMDQYIGKNLNAMQSAQKDLNQMESQTKQLLDQLRSGQADAKSVAQQLQQMMSSPNMKWAASASARAASSAAAAKMASASAKAGGSKPGSGSKPGGKASASPKPGAGNGDGLRTTMPEIVQMDLSGIDLSNQPAAGLYRLPPRLREPLLQAMQERGPEGYQELIDAYYRQLGKEAK